MAQVGQENQRGGRRIRHGLELEVCYIQIEAQPDDMLSLSVNKESNCSHKFNNCCLGEGVAVAVMPKAAIGSTRDRRMACALFRHRSSTIANVLADHTRFNTQDKAAQTLSRPRIHSHTSRPFPT